MLEVKVGGDANCLYVASDMFISAPEATLMVSWFLDGRTCTLLLTLGIFTLDPVKDHVWNNGIISIVYCVVVMLLMTLFTFFDFDMRIGSKWSRLWQCITLRALHLPTLVFSLNDTDISCSCSCDVVLEEYYHRDVVCYCGYSFSLMRRSVSCLSSVTHVFYELYGLLAQFWKLAVEIILFKSISF